MSRKKLAIVLGALLLVAGLVIAITQNRLATASAMATATAPAPTRAVSATTTPAPLAKSAERAMRRSKVSGTLVSENQVSLTFEMPGRVKQVNVKEGERVKAGVVLASLDTSLLDLQVAQAQAALDAAKATLDKAKAGPLTDEIAVAKANLDSAKAAVRQTQAAYDRAGGMSNPYIGMLPEALALEQATNAYRAAVATYNLTVNRPTTTELKVLQAQVVQAQAALDLAKQNAANARIVAPFDGTVVWVGAKAGELGTPGVPAITLADLSKMQVQVGVDESLVASVQIGQSVNMIAEALGSKPLTGRVKKIGLFWVTTGGIVNVPITIDVDATDAPIAPGMSVMVEL